MEQISSEINSHSKYIDISKHIGEEVTIKGVVFKVKALSGFGFVQVFANGFISQCVFEGDLGKTGIKEACAVKLTGKIKEATIKDKFIRPQNAEMVITNFEVLSTPKEVMPMDITKKILNVNNDVKFDYRMLSMRHPKERAIFTIQSAFVQGIREFLISENFKEIRSPKIVKEGAEGGANIFDFKYFGQQAYLTQSPQFYKEFCVGVFDRVFEIAPVFRAEKHNTNRHINEYTSIDLEFGNIESFYDIMNMETACLKYTLNALKEKVPYELELMNVTVPEITTIPALRFHEAKALVKEKYKLQDMDPNDLAPIEEQKIADYVKKETGSDFVFITHYPTEKRPFYAMDDAENPGLTVSFDLLFRGVEITTGGQRIHDYDQLVEKMTKRGMNPDEFSFFSVAHKHGLPPHGGLGMGLERVTQRILELDNVKSATMFPRDISRLTP